MDGDPGERYQYSNTGYSLLGSTLLRIADEPLPEWAQRKIFTPSGMSDSRFWTGPQLAPPGVTPRIPANPRRTRSDRAACGPPPPPAITVSTSAPVLIADADYLLDHLRMPDAAYGIEIDWPIFGLMLRVGQVSLRHVRETDLTHLAAIQPDDFGHDPGPTRFPGHNLAQHRYRLTYQGYWRSLGTWTPDEWCLNFLVERDGEAIGVQSLEAERFPALRTVDSSSWLVAGARGRGIGIAMRRAVLGLAFDHLGARAAVSSARVDNAPSLGVSRHLGYRDNGVSLNSEPAGVTELQHVRLTREEWAAAGLGADVEVVGVQACLPLFGLRQ